VTHRPLIVDGTATRTAVRNATTSPGPGHTAAPDLVRAPTDLLLPTDAPCPSPVANRGGSDASANAPPVAEPRRS
jgi:hypothetical protein